jgi:hypothetical protein
VALAIQIELLMVVVQMVTYLESIKVEQLLAHLQLQAVVEAVATMALG